MLSRLRQFLILCVLGCILIPASAAELNANTASILLDTTVKNLDVKVNEGGQGCAAGQMWDVIVGRCTAPVALRTVSTSQSCSCTCPSSGSCTSSQSGSYQVMGWRLPPNGAEQVSYNSATSWGPCTQVTNACVTVPIQAGTGTGTTGERFYVTAFVCNSGNPGYWRGELGPSYKNMIISAYQSFNTYTRRCPEQDGFEYWQGSWAQAARNYQGEHPGTAFDSALANTWAYPTAYSMQVGAKNNGEDQPSNQQTLNTFCTNYATNAYGRYTPAVYVAGSGDQCLIQ